MTKLQMLNYEGRGKWAHVTDGVHILYIQNDGAYNGYTINSVHKPSKSVGTGYRLISQISRQEVLNNLLRLMSLFCPDWATTQDREATIKYKSPAEFLNYEKKFHEDAKWADFEIDKI